MMARHAPDVFCTRVLAVIHAAQHHLIRALLEQQVHEPQAHVPRNVQLGRAEYVPKLLRRLHRYVLRQRRHVRIQALPIANHARGEPGALEAKR